jgi:hypothetical protein
MIEEQNIDQEPEESTNEASIRNEQPITLNLKPLNEEMDTHAHHLHHAPGNKFWHYFYEFLMLFLAITLGFFVENKREQYTEQHRENQYMRSLVKDLEQDIKNVDTYITNKNKKNQIADSLTSFFFGSNNRSQTSLIYYCARRFSIVDYVFYLTDGTLMQLKNSGGLRLIEKKDIVDSLQSYFNLYQQHEEARQLDFLQLRDYRETMLHMFDVRIFDAMIKNFPVITVPPGNPPLLKKDYALINELLIRVQFCKRINQQNIHYLEELKAKAIGLIILVKKEYNFD